MPEGPQYTVCVEKENWKSVNAAIGVVGYAGAVLAIVAALSGVGIVAGLLIAAASAEILRKVAWWMLNGKLICMNNLKRRVFNDPDPDRLCVVGSVLDFEKVGEDKSGFEKIDNDFALNLFLAPFALAEVAVKDHEKFKHEMERSPQGDLIQDPDSKLIKDDPNTPPGPLMRKDNGKPFGKMPADSPTGFTGYQRDLMFSKAFPRPIPANIYRDPHELVKEDPAFAKMGKDAYADVLAGFSGTVIVNGKTLSDEEKKALLNDIGKDPMGNPLVTDNFYQRLDNIYNFDGKKAQALHCEFEGSRIRDVFNILDFAHVDCDGSGFFGFLCDVLNFLISIFLGLPKLIAAAAAWANADDGTLSNSYDAAGGPIHIGDSIVVRGRWCYDSAHLGYNEIHAVRTVHRCLPFTGSEAGFPAYREAWCSELSKVPPDPPSTRDPNQPPTGAPPPMTGDQQQTYDGQRHDENRWVYHPAIDGCVRLPHDDLPPPIR